MCDKNFFVVASLVVNNSYTTCSDALPSIIAFMAIVGILNALYAIWKFISMTDMLYCNVDVELCHMNMCGCLYSII